MSSSDALPHAPARAFAGESRVRILVFAVLVPMLVWAVNHAIFHSRIANFQFFLFGCYLLFVLEIALISWCVGRYLHHLVLRCAVFLWCIAFIDVSFVLLRFTVRLDFGAVGYSFASAQMGLLIAWAVLGTQSLGLRIFAALCGTTAVMLYVTALSTGFVLQANFGGNDWDSILTWQALATLGLCAVMRWRRFRILPAEDGRSEVKDQASPERVQFSIFHLLIWTLALAPIFAVARLVDWNAIEIPTLARWMQFMSLAILLSVTPLVAIWSGLGMGNLILRILIPLIFTASSGALLAFATVRSWLIRIDVDFYVFRFSRQDVIQVYTFWITWTVLAGFFYLALLLVMRASDHRLIRVSLSRP